MQSYSFRPPIFNRQIYDNAFDAGRGRSETFEGAGSFACLDEGNRLVGRIISGTGEALALSASGDTHSPDVGAAFSKPVLCQSNFEPNLVPKTFKRSRDSSSCSMSAESISYYKYYSYYS